MLSIKTDYLEARILSSHGKIKCSCSVQFLNDTPPFMLVSAPDTSGFLLPTWGDTEQYSDGASSISSFSSNVLKSIVSEMSADQLLCDDYASDLEGDDANFSDCYDDGTDDDDDGTDDDDDGTDDDDDDDDDLEEADDFQVDGSIFNPNRTWLGADLSVEQQFQSLQSGEDF